MKLTVVITGCIAGLLVASALATTVSPPAAQPASKTSTQPAQPPPTPSAPSSPVHQSTAAKKPAPAKEEKKVDINTASLAELKTLPYVSEANAKKIIANRPYVGKVDLVSKAGVPEGVYLAVRDRIVVSQPRTAAAKK